MGKRSLTIKDVPLRLGTFDDGSYIVMGDRLPMLLHGRDSATMDRDVEDALHLVAGYLVGFKSDAISSYLTKRGVPHSLEDEGGKPARAMEFLTAAMALTPRSFGSGVSVQSAR
jgi:hypothetical protein